MSVVNWTEELTQRLLYLYAQKRQQTAIGAELGISRSAVARKLHKLGCFEPKVSIWSEEKTKRLNELVEAGESLAVIKADLGFAKTTIRDCLRRSGLSLKNPRAALREWTEEELDKLTEMRTSGLSYQEVLDSGHFIDRSLEAIKCKCYSLGLFEKRIVPPPLPPLLDRDREGVGVHFFDLDEKTQCRWPIGRLRYCGHSRELSSSDNTRVQAPFYCEKHRKRAIEIQDDRNMTRTKLPPRRMSITKRVAYQLSNGNERHITVTYGIVRGKVSEVFTNSFKAGTDLESLVIDASIMMSRLLQHGDDISDICETLCKPHSLIGALASRAMTLQEELDLDKEEITND